MSDTKYNKVPELSLKSYLYGSPAEKSEFVDQLFSGLKYYGFIILKDHPVSTSLLDEAYKHSKSFFTLPTEKKKIYASDSQRGYTPFGTEHAKDSEVSDLKEFWHVGNELSPEDSYYDKFPKNIWPEEVPEFKDTYLKLYTALEEIGKILLQAITKPLDLPTNYFDKMVTGGNSILRLLHYPPIPENVDPRCVRAAAHEDINLITILVSASSSGLELLDRDGKWLPVETEKNNLIVDAGDMLARITNELIPSTTHRVVNPDDGTNNSRYSMPFFMHPHPEAVLECIPSCEGDKIKYPSILAEEFLQQRLREIGLIK